MTTTAVHRSTTPQSKVKTPTATKTRGSGGEFLVAALGMSWQLAIAVLVPVIGGAELDKLFGTKSIFTFLGLAVAFVASGFVMWRAMQMANRLPVPKVSAAEKRAIQKQYEEDDE
jgi:protein-S-isoprenylcysteine O-methyltransferase Ste14